MIRRTGMTALIAIAMLAAPAPAQVEIDGFVQGLYGGGVDEDNPTATDYTAAETRLQLRLAHYAERGEFFGRVDFLYDGADSSRYDWELREAYAKLRLGESVDMKIGRQILTWGTGDLLFINDVFAKDYLSFFVGRDTQYLKAPQDGGRFELYHDLGNLTVVWIPRFEPNRLPQGRRLSYFDPFSGGIVGEDHTAGGRLPDPTFDNSEVALKFSRYIHYFNLSFYFYRGFYKSPLGAEMAGGEPVPIYPRRFVSGASIRGPHAGGIVWAEVGWSDSRDDRSGDDPLLPNSSIDWFVGYERQVATNLTLNGQWQVNYMLDHDSYRLGQEAMGGYVRDEFHHLLTSRVTKLLMSEFLKLSGVVFYSPTDEDLYLRVLAEYQYSDEITVTAGGNLFAGEHEATEFGQFQKNDNIYGKLTYGF